MRTCRVVLRERCNCSSVLTRRRRFLLGATALFAGTAAALLFGYPENAKGQELVRNVTPAAWQAGDVQWSRDVAPHNKIDDAIDAAPPGTFDIVVNYNHCVEDADITFLQGLPGVTVQMRLKYISAVAVGGVSTAQVTTIAARPEVAFIEQQFEFHATLDVSVPTICVTPGSLSCAGDAATSFSAIDGTGVNIVIMDTGVDNASPFAVPPVHATFGLTPFIAGFDSVNCATDCLPTGCCSCPDSSPLVCPPCCYLVDPDDDFFHGTHVGSIALGQGTLPSTSRGVAPRSGLIDVKVLDATGSGTWAGVTRGLEVVYDNRAVWPVHVVNMSFGGGGASTGLEAFNQLVDLAESMGIVVVVAAGNSGSNLIETPAAATRAITVSATDDLNTPNRGDDVMAFYSSYGPRASDGDADVIDELKPEVAAPGTNIIAADFNTIAGARSLMGTSMAAPHVAGLAALIMQQRPGINAASVKHLIIYTAEPQALYPASLPGLDPVWNDRFGWGYVNAYEALAKGMATDLTYPNYPPNPLWLDPNISVNPPPSVSGPPSTVTVMVLNAGPLFASGVRVHFGIHDYAAAIPTFYDIGTSIVNLPVGVTPVSIIWQPLSPGHKCLETEIGYGKDTDYSNNTTHRNLEVAASPVTFTVQNTLTEDPATIEFVPTFEFPPVGRCSNDPETFCVIDADCPPGGTCVDEQWTVTIMPPNVTLAAEDCPAEIEVLLTPPAGAQPGDMQIVHVAANIGNIELGGVSVKKTVPMPSVCGNDVREDTEACDGTDDACCLLGPCQPDCTCPSPSPVNYGCACADPDNSVSCSNSAANCDVASSDCSTCCAARGSTVREPEPPDGPPDESPDLHGFTCPQSDCGPGPHWIDCCTAGMETLNSNALVGINPPGNPPDDCQTPPMTSLRFSGPVTILRSGPVDVSKNVFPPMPSLPSSFDGMLDGHFDVIDTEIIHMRMTGGGGDHLVRLTAGAGKGQQFPLAPSLGRIVEKPPGDPLYPQCDEPGDPLQPRCANSFFEVFFEVELDDGTFLYNHDPLVVRAVILGLPPLGASYVHGLINEPVCVELYTSPTGGLLVANFVQGTHNLAPLQATGCCLPDCSCTNVPDPNKEDGRSCTDLGGIPANNFMKCSGGPGDGQRCDDLNPCPPPGSCIARSGSCQGDDGKDDVDDACLVACCDHLKGMCTDVQVSKCVCDQCTFTCGTTCAALEVSGGCDPEIWACCDHDVFGSCTNSTHNACNCKKCTWTKGKLCEEVECTHNTIPTVSQWGLVVLTLLLLIGAKIYFARRETATAS